MAELADALDSGSSGHYARAGSSPVIRSNAETVVSKDTAVFIFLESGTESEKEAVESIVCNRVSIIYCMIKSTGKSIDNLCVLMYYR